MFTSDIKPHRMGMIYLAISIFVAFAGAVYEYFSHGVYSYYMIYAFAFPLVLGAVPYLAGYNRSGLNHAAIATLTIGSLMKGALDIYGTTNRLTLVYPVVGIILIAAHLIITLTGPKEDRRQPRLEHICK